MSDTGPALRLRGISKSFDGVRVLRGVDVSITRGTVHALLGGNGSGKSTTLKVVAGVYRGDPGGVVEVFGTPHPADSFSPQQAHRAGLRFVHQDLGLVDDLSVAANFGLVSGFPQRLGAVRWRALHERTARELAAAGLDIAPQAPVRALRPSDRTRVAIARALQDDDGGHPLVLVLDEPTASLPHHEVDELLEELRRRREQGHTIVYVSHRIPEVLAVADDLTVLRDGVVAYSGPVSGLTEDHVIAMMTGLAAEQAAPAARTPRAPTTAAPLLRVSGLCTAGLGPLDLEVRPGEVVGVAGLLGSGRSRLLGLLAGQVPRTSGSVQLAGREIHHRSPRAALADGVACVPEDRARDAAFPDRPLWENVSAIAFPRYARWWGADRRAERRDAVKAAAGFAVHAAHGEVPFASLSGGNQQKAVLARATWTSPRLLLLDEPSQGVDAMARRDIHSFIHRHVDGHDRAALVVSSDFVELAALCDRVLVLRDGRLRAELTGAELHESAIALAVHQDREDPR
ncbi:monosaccharide ABC transporter ATP-binding protein, CUT2 family [Quadrisphaera granulorum]|uniref:Monosaccharide ABC transporter ATP-binding protein (CUT2 family) n=1 Tax=Quadrisphaera granulorum TaxID=317664 RepID=A0A315ZTQ5_9ACTN|nr:sugar ABC transporter ATP-binding protein [Quadrisphaera granulorum]PWJ48290.1 monosaccharide ABC transporter ATP-binding protein (CUT2 family) [Quadrisphaera granulorum]SZE98451.1 monosaccharide ABC transporter ATP-binding protein, CUT2 family [Quadrisphaera granulorum]